MLGDNATIMIHTHRTFTEMSICDVFHYAIKKWNRQNLQTRSEMTYLNGKTHHIYYTPKYIKHVL